MKNPEIFLSSKALPTADLSIVVVDPTLAKKKRRFRIMRVLFFLFVLYALWLAFLYCNQDQLLYPGAFAELAPAKPNYPAGMGYESVWIEPEPGVRVEAWFAAGEGRTRSTPGPAVILTHGNYEVIDTGTWNAQGYRRMGFSVLLVEFRGYGRSIGRPTQAGITADMVAFYDRLAARPEIDPRKIVIHGRSIGGAAAAQLAAARPPAALILQSSFRSADSMTWGYFAPPLLLRDSWRTDAVVAKLNCPLLLLHGMGDNLIPPSHSQALAKIAKKPTLAILQGTHNMFPVNEGEYWRSIREFLIASGILEAN